MDVDAPTFTRRVVDDGPQNLVDDDDLQAALARSRRTNARSKPKIRPEDLAAQSKQHQFIGHRLQLISLVAERKAEEDIPQANGDEDGRITFDDTSEFVRNVNAESLATQVKRERAATPTTQTEEPIVVKVERVEPEDAEMESEDEDEDDTLAEIAAREGLSLAEYRLKIERQMNEMAEIKAEDEVSSINHCG
jgi:U4/U6.U5 tri-snRNP-associated protein 1